jgi:REP element-mobilizing transposase RayT
MIARSPFQDYRAPAFYMVTMTTHGRRPWFGVCADNRCVLNEDGWLVRDLWLRIARDYPQIEVSTLCIMPDHLHGIVRVKERLEKPVGVALRAFKSQATGTFRKKYDDKNLTLWNEGYNDRCVWRSGALAAFTRYLLDNPRRYCLKKANPDLFRRIEHLSHPCLPPPLPLSSSSVGVHADTGFSVGVHADTGTTWTGYGNLFLLDKPEKRAVRVSRSATPAQIEAQKKNVLAEAANGVVAVSPFISPGEREIAKAILDAEKGDVILLKPDGFPPLFKPKGRFFDLCVAGRLLILSSMPAPAEGAPPPALTREVCLQMNAACEHIAFHSAA